MSSAKPQVRISGPDFEFIQEEPTRDEIENYARFLGLDPLLHPDLMWIAREGLTAPLPQGWKPCQTPKGELYYYNSDTGKSSWCHPLDEYYQAKAEEEKSKKLGSRSPAAPPAHSSPLHIPRIRSSVGAHGANVLSSRPEPHFSPVIVRAPPESPSASASASASASVSAGTDLPRVVPSIPKVEFRHFSPAAKCHPTKTKSNSVSNDDIPASAALRAELRSLATRKSDLLATVRSLTIRKDETLRTLDVSEAKIDELEVRVEVEKRRCEKYENGVQDLRHQKEVLGGEVRLLVERCRVLREEATGNAVSVSEPRNHVMQKSQPQPQPQPHPHPHAMGIELIVVQRGVRSIGTLMRGVRDMIGESGLVGILKDGVSDLVGALGKMETDLHARHADDLARTEREFSVKLEAERDAVESLEQKERERLLREALEAMESDFKKEERTRFLQQEEQHLLDLEQSRLVIEKSHSEEMASLEALLRTERERSLEATKEARDAKARVASLEDREKSLKEAHSAEIESLRVANKKTLESLQASQEEELQSIRESHKAELESVGEAQETREAREADVKERIESAISDLRTSHEKEMGSVKVSHEEELRNLGELHAEEVRTICDDARRSQEKALEDLRSELLEEHEKVIERLQSQLEQQQRKAEPEPGPEPERLPEDDEGVSKSNAQTVDASKYRSVREKAVLLKKKLLRAGRMVNGLREMVTDRDAELERLRSEKNEHLSRIAHLESHVSDLEESKARIEKTAFGPSVNVQFEDSEGEREGEGISQPKLPEIDEVEVEAEPEEEEEQEASEIVLTPFLEVRGVGATPALRGPEPGHGVEMIADDEFDGEDVPSRIVAEPCFEVETISESMAMEESIDPGLQGVSEEEIEDERGFTETYSSFQRQALAKLKGEEIKLRRAVEYVRREKLAIVEQQKKLLQARREWKADLRSTKKHSEAYAVLAGVKRNLDDHARQMNQNTKQVNRIQQYIRLRREKIKLLRDRVMSLSSEVPHQAEENEDSEGEDDVTFSPCDSESDDMSEFVALDGVEVTAMTAQEADISRYVSKNCEVVQMLNRIEKEICTIGDNLSNQRRRDDDRTRAITAEPQPHHRRRRTDRRRNVDVDVEPHQQRKQDDRVLQQDPMSNKWSFYFDRWDRDYSNRLTDFRLRMAKWNEGREIERQILDSHCEWLRRFQRELEKSRFRRRRNAARRKRRKKPPGM